MKYRLFGNSGLRVSEISLGTMTFGEDWGWGSSKDEARKIYDAYRQAGGNFIDTANVYTNGSSETFVGEFIRDHRESVVLATKYSNAGPGNDANAAGNQRKNMVQAVEHSLRRLQTDYIDLYWMHVWDRMTPVEEVMRAFDDLVRQGKVLYIGVSDAPAWWTARANTLAELRGWTQFIGLQIEYSLVERTVERELIPMAKELKLGVVAWSPLGGGLLSGKYHSGHPGDGRFASDMIKSFQRTGERPDRIVAALQKVAAQTGRSAAQVALAWLRYRPISVIPIIGARRIPLSVIPIIGARRIPQLEDNLASLELQLSPEQVAVLDEASAVDLGFPYELYRNELANALAYGGMRDKIVAA